MNAYKERFCFFFWKDPGICNCAKLCDYPVTTFAQNVAFAPKILLRNNKAVEVNFIGRNLGATAEYPALLATLRMWLRVYPSKFIHSSSKGIKKWLRVYTSTPQNLFIGLKVYKKWLRVYASKFIQFYSILFIHFEGVRVTNEVPEPKIISLKWSLWNQRGVQGLTYEPWVNLTSEYCFKHFFFFFAD